MLVDTTLGDLGSAAADGKAAEDAGYAGAFTGELNNDPFLPLALAAAATRDLTIGTSIAVAFARSPMALAYTAHDLQRLSRGRLMIGLGSQVRVHITRRYSMPWGRPAAQMREFVLAMRAAWRNWEEGMPLAFEGEHYRHTLMPPMFTPAPHGYGMPPVLLAGVGDAMTRVAGEVADGFLCHGFTTERWIREHTLPALEEGRRRAGLSMDSYIVKAAVFLATGTEQEISAAARKIRSSIAFYASTPAYRPILDLHGWGAVGEELTRLSREGRWAAMDALITDDMLHAFAIVAPPAQVPQLLARRCAGLVSRVSFIGGRPPRELLDAVSTGTLRPRRIAFYRRSHRPARLTSGGDGGAGHERC
ncbi:MAG TPA: TIGR03617 family F420-dependent LLM class oxidoreductase [Trebonia sp.]|nr:TIGR03617 family F420-dependent LLM class oxidoreductase [Trebonia sp.]